MPEKGLFLQWTLFACLMAIGVFIAAGMGWIGYLKDDPTHITLLTLLVFILATYSLGRLSWRFSNGEDPRDLEYDLDHGWFGSGLCVSIGLIGTAVGYYIMLKNGNAAGEPADVMREAFANTSIAIVNTVFGAICGVFVEVQSHFIGHAIKRSAKRIRAEEERVALEEAVRKAVEALVLKLAAAAPAPSQETAPPAVSAKKDGEP